MDPDGCTLSQQKVSSFLCMALFYQHFIPACSYIAKLLYALTAGQKRERLRVELWESRDLPQINTTRLDTYL